VSSTEKKPYVPDYERYPDCQTCQDIHEKHKGFGPTHDGSKSCLSGSIASGGKRSHCTCDWCFQFIFCALLILTRYACLQVM